MAEREYAEIEQYDVGRSTFHAFGRAWSVADFIGAITDADVGKRVYRTSKHVVSVENAEQFKARLEVEARATLTQPHADLLKDREVKATKLCSRCGFTEIAHKMFKGGGPLSLTINGKTLTACGEFQDSNSERLARHVYDLLSSNRPPTGALGVDLVRPPNPAHGHAVAVLFADGKDVVVRFEESGGR